MFKEESLGSSHFRNDQVSGGGQPEEFTMMPHVIFLYSYLLLVFRTLETFCEGLPDSFAFSQD